jgi:uncharacterized protein (DUF4415 family)
MKKAPKNFRVDGVLEADVTQEEYDAEVLAGVEPEFRVKPGRHTMLRGRFDLNPEDAQPRNTKVKVSMYLDLDVLNFFKQRASRANAAPYQTQINSELRRIMELEERGQGAENHAPPAPTEWIHDDRTIRLLAKRLDEVRHSKGKRSP